MWHDLGFDIVPESVVDVVEDELFELLGTRLPDGHPRDSARWTTPQQAPSTLNTPSFDPKFDCEKIAKTVGLSGVRG